MLLLCRRCLGSGILTVLTVSFLAGQASAQLDLTSPDDDVVGVLANLGGDSAIAVAGTTAAVNNFPAAESPDLAFDNNTATKYLNFAELNTGVIVTPMLGSTTVGGLRVTTANDAPERDPLTFTIEGTNDANPSTALGAAWSLIFSGDTGLATDPGRFMAGPVVRFDNSDAYTGYRVLFPTVRDSAAANSMQISEIELFPVPEPTTISLVLGALAWGWICIQSRSRR